MIRQMHGQFCLHCCFQLQENYGRKGDDNEQAVKALYREMNLEQVYLEYEERSYNELQGLLSEVTEVCCCCCFPYNSFENAYLSLLHLFLLLFPHRLLVRCSSFCSRKSTSVKSRRAQADLDIWESDAFDTLFQFLSRFYLLLVLLSRLSLWF